MKLNSWVKLVAAIVKFKVIDKIKINKSNKSRNYWKIVIDSHETNGVLITFKKKLRNYWKIVIDFLIFPHVWLTCKKA